MGKKFFLKKGVQCVNGNKENLFNKPGSTDKELVEK